MTPQDFAGFGAMLAGLALAFSVAAGVFAALAHNGHQGVMFYAVCQSAVTLFLGWICLAALGVK